MVGKESRRGKGKKEKRWRMRKSEVDKKKKRLEGGAEDVKGREGG